MEVYDKINDIKKSLAECQDKLTDEDLNGIMKVHVVNNTIESAMQFQPYRTRQLYVDAIYWLDPMYCRI